eukprot:938023-Amphidinium_carterae.2
MNKRARDMCCAERNGRSLLFWSNPRDQQNSCSCAGPRSCVLSFGGTVVISVATAAVFVLMLSPEQSGESHSCPVPAHLALR